ncbi:family 43 glycosylhydrolase [Halopelagius fulvigenes]|uniref:Family 43 glycosylhydrolase n=1 Tax=Halopelagius fulvigenes TaxID=1198324 RepID=A0ABD5TX05_9EURY
MRRRRFLAGSVGVAGLSGCAGSPPDGFDGGPTETYRNPVFERVFPDPSVVRAADGTFYAYGTEEDGERFRRVPIVESEDLVNWTRAGEAFESKPDWRDGAYLWAPDVVRMNGTYYLYYSYADWGDENPGIGVATGDDPAGPFTDRGKLFRGDEIGVENSIDPMVFLRDGAPYLFWGSRRGIYAIALRSDGLDTRGEKTRIAGDHYEGAYVVERGGRYYFFGSVGTCCEGMSSTYHVRAGRSDSLLGPYEGADGNDLREAKGPVVVEGGNGFVGPGHNAVVTDDAGDDWLLYHAYEEGEGYVEETPRRILMVDCIDWSDGWPTVEGKTPSRAARVPRID